MGLLVDGRWQEDVSRTKDGHFIRPATQHHNYVTADGSPGPSGSGGFLAERGRYHLYVSLACPWAHRTLIVRKLKKLEDVISVSITEPLYGKTDRHRADRAAHRFHGAARPRALQIKRTACRHRDDTPSSLKTCSGRSLTSRRSHAASASPTASRRAATANSRRNRPRADRPPTSRSRDRRTGHGGGSGRRGTRSCGHR